MTVMSSFFVVKMWHLLPLAPNGCLAVRFSTILRQPFVAERCIYRILTTKIGSLANSGGAMLQKNCLSIEAMRTLIA